MYPERDIHLIKIRNDKQIPVIGISALSCQILRKVDHREQNIPGLKNPFYRRMGVRYRFDFVGHHNLPYLCHIDPIQFSEYGELHYLNLICS